MGSASSGHAIRSISEWGTTISQRPVTAAKKLSDDFGSLTFNDTVQRARLPKDVYRALRRAVADAVQRSITNAPLIDSEAAGARK